MIQENLFKYVERLGISNAAIARGTGMTDMALSSSRRMQRKLTAEEYYRICSFMGVSLDKFTQQEDATDLVEEVTR